jgi:hypothetical protein
MLPRFAPGVLASEQRSAYDELVVADYGNSRVVMFGASGELLKTMGRGEFTGVAIHGGTRPRPRL